MNFKLFLNKNEKEHLNKYLKKSYFFIVLMKIISFLTSCISVFLFPVFCYILIALISAFFGIDTSIDSGISYIYRKIMPIIIIFIILSVVFYIFQLNKLNNIFKKYNIKDKKTFKSDIIPLYILEFPILESSILLCVLNRIFFFLYIIIIITCLIFSIKNIKKGFTEDKNKLLEENI